MENTIREILAQVHMLPSFIIELFFFVSAVLQSTFPPYPGDTVLIFGGYLAITARSPLINIYFPYLVGTLLSCYALFELARWKGDQILSLRLVRRYFPEAKQAKACKRVEKYGTAALFICKYIPGLNSIIIIFSGIFRCKRFPAYTGITLAALIHNTAFFVIGRIVGSNWENIRRFLIIYNKIVLSAAVAAALVLASLWAWNCIRKRNLGQQP